MFYLCFCLVSLLLFIRALPDAGAKGFSSGTALLYGALAALLQVYILPYLLFTRRRIGDARRMGGAGGQSRIGERGPRPALILSNS